MTTNTLAVPRAGTAVAHAHGSWLRFLGHFVEMVVVMLIGMGVLTAILGMPHGSPVEIQALYMAATMTVPMVGWMLFRGHSRRATAQMSAAMVIPLAVLLPLQWAAFITADAVIDLQHLLMLPAMLGAMLLRRTEYGL